MSASPRPPVLAVTKLNPLYLERLHAPYEVLDRLQDLDPAAFAKVAPQVHAIAASGE